MRFKGISRSETTSYKLALVPDSKIPPEVAELFKQLVKGGRLSPFRIRVENNGATVTVQPPPLTSEYGNIIQILEEFLAQAQLTVTRAEVGVDHERDRVLREASETTNLPIVE